MKKGSTLFLRLVILLISVVVLALCVFVFPTGIRSPHSGGYRPILLGMYLTTIPFFFALFQTLKLLDYIDKNKAFSTSSIQALKYIKYCAIAISVMYGIGMPYIFFVANKDDAPGVVLLGLIFTFAPLLAAVLAAVLEKLFRNAIELKSENELTV